MAGYGIILQPSAICDLDALRRTDAVRVADGLEQFLTNEPKRESKSRIKRLRGLRHPQYRLRIDEIRVFYDVTEERVEILVIVPKSRAADWLQEKGERQ